MPYIPYIVFAMVLIAGAFQIRTYVTSNDSQEMPPALVLFYVSFYVLCATYFVAKFITDLKAGM